MEIVTSGSPAGAREHRADGPWTDAGRRAVTAALPRRRSGRWLGVEDEAELADLDLVAGLQRGLVDALAVDVGAVERADVADDEAVALAAEVGVLARDGDVVEEDVAVGVPAGVDLVVVEQEARAGVGSAQDDEQRRAGPQRVDGGLVGLG